MMKVNLTEKERELVREWGREDIGVIVAADPTADVIIEKLPRLCLARDILRKIEREGGE